MSTKLETEKHHFESIFDNLTIESVNEVFQELSTYNWSNKVTRQAFLGALDFGLWDKYIPRCYATVTLILLLHDLPDFKPIVAKYREKFREDTEALLTGTYDIANSQLITNKYTETIFLLFRYRLVTEKMTCEFLTRLITPPRQGKHIASFRMFVVARVISRMPADFPATCRKEWIPNYIEQLKRFYEIEKDRNETKEVFDIFNEESFPILYEGVMKGLMRAMKVESDKLSKEDTIDINTIRCKTFLPFFQKSNATLNEELDKKSRELKECHEKLVKFGNEITENQNKLKEMKEASKKKKRIEINVRNLKSDNDRVLKEITELIISESKIKRRKERLEEMEKSTRADLKNVALPWICFHLPKDVNGPSTSSN